jgi:DNA-binding transcriptional LysR family regulator
MTKAGDLQFDWLRVLVAIIDSGSLSAAALQVHRSQGAVSVQLANLEEAAGQKLVHRGPRRSTPTPAGLQLLGYARQMLSLHSEACAAMGARPLTGESARVSRTITLRRTLRLLSSRLRERTVQSMSN